MIAKIFKILLILLWCGSSEAQTIQQALKEPMNIWVKQNFGNGKIPPFSFQYGGKDSHTFIKKWNYRSERLESGQADMEKYLFTYSEPGGGLIVKCYITVYRDFQAVEWMLKFSNSSAVNGPLLEKVCVVNREFISIEKGDFILHHALGSNAHKEDFSPIDDTLGVQKNIKMAPQGGRGSSDETALPFFNIESPDNRGIMAAIGWTGKWYAEVCQKDESTLSLKAGMERMKLTLYPREEIRTPKVCLLFWENEDRMHGHNLFRQFVLKHHTRKIDGRFAELPLASGIARGGPSPCNEFTCLTESYAIAIIERFRQFDMIPEVCWIDAGWYPGGDEWWEGVGNLYPDPRRFPNGLKPVADAVHRAGSKLLVWFEPERARKGTQIAKEHPEWLLPYPGTTNQDNLYNRDTYLFDLGNEDARLWLTGHVTDFLRKEGIDYYRQDFNWVDAEGSWKMKDEPGREGLSEIRHIEGLYAFWDSLLVRFPNLLIDNCASGGRRIDLESISRTSPLWRTDYATDDSEGKQNHSYGLNFYLPLHGTGIFKSSPYDFHSAMSSSMVLFWDINSSSGSIPQMQKCMKDFKALRPYYYGDYYPLTSATNMNSDNIWLAYQLNRPEHSDGIIMAFRRKNCKDKSIVAKIRGIKKEARYELVDNTGLKVIRSGKEMIEGVELTVNESPGSLLINYKLLE